MKPTKPTKKTVTKKTKKPLASDWRGKVLSRIRALITQADAEVIEDVKWKTALNPAGVFVWYRDGMICTGETYAQHLRLTFAKGPALKAHDPKGIINTHRAAVIHEDDKLNEAAFKKLIRAAVALNREGKDKRKTKR